MGANAQTTVPTFTTGQVLTADEMNQSARTGVPVFANTSARDAGFGGTGEKTLAEGQLCYLEDTNVVQYYDGSVWATVGPQTFTSGLNYVTGATFTTASTVSLPNSTFTSTYRNYRIQLVITANSTDDTTLALRMRASGSDDATGYYGSIFGVNNAADTFRVVRSNNATSFALGNIRTTANADSSYSFDVINPQQAEITQWSGSAQTTLSTDSAGAAFGGWENSTTQFDAMSFIPAAGTITGYYRVYGYADA